MNVGPIVKDATYYGFWSAALLCFILSQVSVIGMLYLILREVRK